MGYELELVNLERERGFLFWLDVDGFFYVCVNKINILNGFVWIVDNKIMYYIDLFFWKVYGFDYDIEMGNISKYGSCVILFCMCIMFIFLFVYYMYLCFFDIFWIIKGNIYG